jgi:ATP-dependent helicase STH1/SNF2
LIEKKKQLGPFLIIIPLATMTNWVLEFEKWAPSVTKIVFKGGPAERKRLGYEVRNGNFNVLITTFEYIIKERPILCKVKWVYMIIDEGHRMKNAQSKLSTTLMQYYYSRYRVILTGTPLQVLLFFL